MKITKATENDAEALSKFFSQQVLHGPVDVQLTRPGHFFDQYKLHSKNFDVFILRDLKNEVCGMAAIIYREAYINGEVTRIGYCTDLRIASTREAVLTWTKHFLPVLQEVLRDQKCQYFFSVVVPQDSRAYNALVRPRSSRRNIPRFYMLGRFELVTVIGRTPWASKPLDTIEIKKGDTEDIDGLVSYLDRKSKERTLSYVFTKELLESRIRDWPGFGIESFLIAKDSQSNIIGCVAPWDSYEVQHMTIMEYHGFSKTLKSAMNIASLVGLTQRMPKVGEALNYSYLTHLYADNPDIFYSLLYESYELAKPTKSLCYAHFVNNLITLPPKTFISTTFPLAVYSLLPPDQPLPEFLKMSRLAAPPDLEVAFL